MLCTEHAYACSILIPILPYYAIQFGAGAFELGMIMAIFSGGLRDLSHDHPILRSSIAHLLHIPL